MASSTTKRSTRRLSIFQFGAIVLAIALIASLVGALTAGLALPAVGAAGAVAKAIPVTFREMPSDIEVIEPGEESRLLDSEGRVLARFYADRRTIVASDQIAPIMKQAIIAIEDRRFYSHHGIDPDGMARALVSNMTSGNTQGASTITQQYVKNMLIQKGLEAGDQNLIDDATEVSAERKLREMRYAISLESTLTKDEILTGYLNLAAFGTNIYGVEASSRTYFSKSANELTPGEAALLAGIVQDPPTLDPLVNPELAQERRNIVLGEMLEQGFITETEYDEAVGVSVEDMLNISFLPNGCSGAGTSAYFCRYAIETFLQDEAYGADRSEREHLLNTGGLTLRTTLNRATQDAAYRAVVGRVPVGDGSGLNVALTATSPQTGHILAMAQNTPYGVATEQNPTATEVSFNADPAHGGGTGFQAGSTFKIFTLVQWFYESRSAYEVVGGQGNTFPNGSFKCGGSPIMTELWTPGESDGAKRGSYNVIDATRMSVNQAFGDMATKIDFCQIFERAAAMGITDHEGQTIAPYPGNLIGSADVTPLDMSTAFGTLADNGTKCTPIALTEVEDRSGVIMKSYAPNCAPVIDSLVARQVTKVLEKAYQSADFGIGRPFAGKSGTTDENANVWFAGFTPQLSAAMWAGVATDSSRPGQHLMINGQYHDYLYGGTFLGASWAAFMAEALADQPVQGFEDVFIGNIPVVIPPKTTPDPAADPAAGQADATAEQPAQENG